MELRALTQKLPFAFSNMLFNLRQATEKRRPVQLFRQTRAADGERAWTSKRKPRA